MTWTVSLTPLQQAIRAPRASTPKKSAKLAMSNRRVPAQKVLGPVDIGVQSVRSQGNSVATERYCIYVKSASAAASLIGNRNPEQRELFLSGLRLAMGETA